MNETTRFDINGPLEAVHRDTGQVVEARLNPNLSQPDSDGDYWTEPLPGDWWWFKSDGSPGVHGNPWSLRNRAPAPDLETLRQQADALGYALVHKATKNFSEDFVDVTAERTPRSSGCSFVRQVINPPRLDFHISDGNVIVAQGAAAVETLAKFLNIERVGFVAPKGGAA